MKYVLIEVVDNHISEPEFFSRYQSVHRDLCRRIAAVLICRQLMLSARGLTMKNLRRITRFLKMKRGANTAVCATSGKYVSFMKMTTVIKCKNRMKECMIW